MAIAYLCLVNFIDGPFHKLADVDVGDHCEMFESVDHSISMRDVQSIAKSFLLGIVLVKSIFDIDSVIVVLKDCVVLQFGGLREPFIDSVEVGIVV